MIRDYVNFHAATNDLGKNLRAVSHQANRDSALLLARGFANVQRFVQRLRDAIAIAGAHAALDARRIYFDAEEDRTVQRRREWLGAAHAAESARQQKLAAEIAAEMPVGHRGESFKRTLHDALRADVNPTARGHLAVHHQAFAFEFVKVIPVRPRAHQI